MEPWNIHQFNITPSSVANIPITSSNPAANRFPVQLIPAQICNQTQSQPDMSMMNPVMHSQSIRNLQNSVGNLTFNQRKPVGNLMVNQNQSIGNFAIHQNLPMGNMSVQQNIPMGIACVQGNNTSKANHLARNVVLGSNIQIRNSMPMQITTLSSAVMPQHKNVQSMPRQITTLSSAVMPQHKNVQSPFLFNQSVCTSSPAQALIDSASQNQPQRNQNQNSSLFVVPPSSHIATSVSNLNTTASNFKMTKSDILNAPYRNDNFNNPPITGMSNKTNPSTTASNFNSKVLNQPEAQNFTKMLIKSDILNVPYRNDNFSNPPNMEMSNKTNPSTTASNSKCKLLNQAETQRFKMLTKGDTLNDPYRNDNFNNSPNMGMSNKTIPCTTASLSNSKVLNQGETQNLGNLQKFLKQLVASKNDLTNYFQNGTSANRVLVDILCYKKFRQEFLEKSNNTKLKEQIMQRLTSANAMEGESFQNSESMNTVKSKSIQDIFDTLLAVTTLKTPPSENPTTMSVQNIKREPGLRKNNLSSSCNGGSNFPTIQMGVLPPLQGNPADQRTDNQIHEPFQTNIEDLIRMADEAAEPFTCTDEHIPVFRPINTDSSRDVKPNLVPPRQTESNSYCEKSKATYTPPIINRTPITAVEDSSSRIVNPIESLVPSSTTNKESPQKALPKKRKEILRPLSPNNMCRVEAEDQLHICSSLIESKISDNKTEDLLRVKKEEVICALASDIGKDGSVACNAMNDRSTETSYYWCNFCVFQTDNKSKLVNHVISAHRFSCQYCRFQCYSRADVVDHTIKTHKNTLEISKDFRYCVLLPDYLKILDKIEHVENETIENELLQNFSVKKIRTSPEDEEDCIESDWEEEVLGEYNSDSEFSSHHSDTEETKPTPIISKKRKRKIKRAFISSSSEEEVLSEDKETKTKNALEELKRKRTEKKARFESEKKFVGTTNKSKNVLKEPKRAKVGNDVDSDKIWSKNLRKRNKNIRIGKPFEVLDALLGDDTNDVSADDDSDADSDFIPNSSKRSENNPSEQIVSDSNHVLRSMLDSQGTNTDAQKVVTALLTSSHVSNSTKIVSQDNASTSAPQSVPITAGQVVVFNAPYVSKTTNSVLTLAEPVDSNITSNFTENNSITTASNSVISSATSTSDIASTTTSIDNSIFTNTTPTSDAAETCSPSTTSTTSSNSFIKVKPVTNNTKVCFTKYCLHCDFNSLNIYELKLHTLNNHPRLFLGFWHESLDFLFFLCPEKTCEFYGSMSADFLRHITKCKYKTNDDVHNAVAITTEYLKYLKEKKFPKSSSIEHIREILSNLSGKSDPVDISSIIASLAGTSDSDTAGSEQLAAQKNIQELYPPSATSPPSSSESPKCTPAITSFPTPTISKTTGSSSKSNEDNKNEEDEKSSNVEDFIDTDTSLKCAFCSFKSMGNIMSVRSHTTKHHPNYPLYTINLKAVEEGKKLRFIIFCVGIECEEYFMLPKKYFEHIDTCDKVKKISDDRQLVKTIKFVKNTVHKL